MYRLFSRLLLQSRTTSRIIKISIYIDLLSLAITSKLIIALVFTFSIRFFYLNFEFRNTSSNSPVEFNFILCKDDELICKDKLNFYFHTR